MKPKIKEIHKQKLMERMTQNIIASLVKFKAIDDFLFSAGISPTFDLVSNVGVEKYVMDRLSRTPTEKLLKIAQEELDGLDISDLLK